MTARRPVRRASAKRRGHRVTLPEIICAPELAVLAVLNETLDVSLDALLAAQPALVGDPPPWRLAPDLLAARRVVACAVRLATAIESYRRAVAPRPATEPEDDGSTPADF